MILDLHLEQFDENLALICRGSFEYRVIIVLPMPFGLLMASSTPVKKNISYFLIQTPLSELKSKNE